jgi:hypothetical protein
MSKFQDLKNYQEELENGTKSIKILRFQDNFRTIELKLRYLSESISCWDEKRADLDDDFKVGFAFLMEDTINELAEYVKALD